MEKKTVPAGMKVHSVLIDDRKSIEFTGVEDVGDFTEEQIQVYTTKGCCIVKGKGLKVQSLDLNEGKVAVEGNIISLLYTDKKNRENLSLIGKIFK
ncbi:MAG: sporulation protein YabP [Firmicutes bacterium]|nr:sporulation protein YabP [Clostridiales bacterium]MBQ2845577.1 sporulation protein YabP [Bacillota bacterium]MBQ4340828.1 sporulation protein YabP [Bacillota bacterium]